MNRVARCACGSSSVAVVGEPKVSCICHCTNCKRRTGGAFGLSAYFLNADLSELSGDLSVYSFRHAEDQYDEDRYFCKQCGTTLYWRSSNRPHLVGVAGGCLPEEGIAPPTASYSTSKKLAWVELPDDCKIMERPPRTTVA